MQNKVYVTSPLLPPLEEFIPYLETLWESKILTNGGQFHQQLEQALADYLGVKHVCLFSNGTLALLTALQTLRISGEVITTPYSFVATSHSLLWNDLTPVFADIDPVTFNIDPDKIEELITPKTTAILPVHCYGIPCDMERIQRIADTYGLKVIYDAAHCFGVKENDSSILNYGDLSVLSFHATKVFNTFEGGAIICHDAKTKQRIDYLKNFGFADETVVMAPGINAKMNEVQAAMGLLQLKYIDGALEERAIVYQRYVNLLRESLPEVKYITPADNVSWNYSYFPVLFDDFCRVSRDDVYTALRQHNIYARRYFYPLISAFPMYRHFPTANVSHLPVADGISQAVLCLPIFPGLAEEEQHRIVEVIKSLFTEAEKILEPALVVNG
ncbi:DegT/DnrJ/EryC1/StrS family aminotransferase [Cronobacter sakazakii]|uniref:DegT/DnrJ/EryC1/StrS family aminotransferase n=1 Tax=Cronobacter TaxID=413496 RepID=UPI00029C6B79|nr:MULTISPECIES: DegT/DnrJ/EryC1/StrS family aminotransferase [Cronobacter]CCK07530.1 Aminotransferase, DegT/DnrJ/EryC1/StrS family [Cronobacter sakazakii 696]AXX02556.1 DegT/DnrJ/EryC1/StrS family aminotransferase [Cronobacter sakazakii]EGT5183011.1 DegT/DnrJ/EryC1/StrS family aminotransferase [Cronobacter sakazakii]EGT5204743.1 DegT/DnrJ/EryC1/StrS family aminotransferase [Cronobacter sakazakii]EGT5754456.1 DegT/DnrJ/EryC1/StrS family aminotransferase [Cronobacter sakazakii]